ncbi:hypothetical protein IKF33_02370 [Candidatus Saccharibacteria bacterium]|nr:hypothetical protein [Candidatus Saccharibacteria bacterium]
MPQKTAKRKITKRKIPKLPIILVAVLALIIAAFCVWQICIPHPMRMSETVYGSNEQIDLTADEYNQLTQDKASFIVFIDQTNCITANKLREMLGHIADEHQIHIYHIMWADISDTNLREKVKYYPSVAIIQNGQVVDALDANADAHTAYYNSEADLKDWLSRYVEL